MTLAEVKKKVLSLIEEINTSETNLTDDPDIAAKLNYVINQVQFELARMKKISAKLVRNVSENEELDLSTIENFYQLKLIRFKDNEGNYNDYDIVDNLVTFNSDGVASIYYYKYPEAINEKTSNSYEMELSADVLEVLPYGVAADLLKSDVSSGYGQIYAQRYNSMIQILDSRYNTGSIYIEGGVNL